MAALPSALASPIVAPSMAIRQSVGDGIAALLAAIDVAQEVDVGATMRALIDGGVDRLPRPGGGETLARWRGLAEVGGFDLCVAKIFESHLDARAIADEVRTRVAIDGSHLLAVWASEAAKPLAIVGGTGTPALRDGDRVLLSGSKAWCSGATWIDTAFVTARDASGERVLVAVSMHQPTITTFEDRWRAVGMRASRTAEVLFDDAEGYVVGAPGEYLKRPGFWHGGIGVAAVWYGAAAMIATRMRELQRARNDVHARARLGRIDGLLAGAGALLRECARTVDGHPTRVVAHDAMRARSLVAATCDKVLEEALNALGPGPFCTDPRLARLASDLPIFVRQVRGEHDLVAQANALLEEHPDPAVDGWVL